MLRLTQDCDISEIEELIKTMEPSQYIIGSELSAKGKRHFHVFLVVTKTKDQLKALINAAGYKGNKDYNLKDADDNSKVKKYCLKDGEFLHYGVPQYLIDSWIVLSHKKVDVGYTEALSSLETRYVTQGDFYSDLDFSSDVLRLAVSYGKKPRRAHHVPYMNYMRIKKNPNYAVTLAANWLDIHL
jgi:hypothetical protein